MKLTIERKTTVGQALAAEPRLYGALLSLGLCCVDENTVMWTMEQILGKSVDKRLAALLIEEAQNTGEEEFSLTHDRAARELGTAREVVTRILKQFQADGLVKLTRGRVTVIDAGKLGKI